MADGQAAPAAPISQDLRGVPEPVLKIQALLDAEKAPPPEQAAPAAKEQADSAQEAQPEPEAEAGVNRQVEGDEGAAEDAPKYAEIPLDQLEAIELETTYKGDDGKDITEKLPVKALREGYMRQKDYQRKTAEVARQREEVGEKVRHAIESDRTAYQQQLQQMQDLLIQTAAPELKDVNWNDLAANNAFEYVRLRNRADQVQQALKAINAKQQELAAKQQSEAKEARDKLVTKAQQDLQEAIPGWGDDMYQTLMKSSAKHGFKPEEVATWADARAIKLLHKANLYDQLQAEKKTPAAEKKVVVPPKVIRPGPAQGANQRQQQEQSAMKKLQGSGKLEDAAAVIRQRLG